MDEPLFRKKSMDRISSPEALSDYLHVTSPTVWMILIAIILLLVGVLVWSSTANIDSFATGSAQVENGSMVIRFDNEKIAQNVKTGMTIVAGETESRISTIGKDAFGSTFATASTTLSDGTYSVKVLFRQTQVINLLFN